MEQASSSRTFVKSSLVTLPVEVLVYILSFLSTPDKVRIRCTSKILRTVGKVPSLWEDFIWSRYASRDEKLLDHTLKAIGKNIKRIHFAGPPIAMDASKLQAMLKFCVNLIHLSLPLFDLYGNFEKLEKIVHSIGTIQVLDISVPAQSIDKGRVLRQTFAVFSNLRELSLHFGVSTWALSDTIQQWLEEWANNNYVPRKLNIFFRNNHTSFLQSYLPVLRNKTLRKMTDSEEMACANFYMKTITDSSATIPFVQLRVTDSSVYLSSVKASKYGILGLDYETLQLTEGSYRGKKVHKALLTVTNNEYIDTSVTSLSSVTYFDASYCKVLYPGHLEQLSIACPNLQRLGLTRNQHCLNNLQGLRSLADNCKSLQGLSLMDIHLHDCEYSCIQLWEILCSMRLTQLGIEACMINVFDYRKALSKPSASGENSAQVKHQNLTYMFQQYGSLQVLEVGIQRRPTYESCYNPNDYELLLLTNFPSITYYRLCSLPSNDCHYTLKRIFGQKYLRRLFLSKRSSGNLSLSLEGHCSSLQQLYIHSEDTELAETFIDALCSHGGLEHVILFVKSLTAKSIENMIKHSSNLLTFHVYLYSRGFLNAKQVTAAIKEKFSKRKLFNGGSFHLASFILEVNDDTDLLSLWDSG